MVDAEKREKVIRGLEACSSSGPLCPQNKCPYNGHALTCKYVLMRDALALLKEQEPRVMTLGDVRRDHDRVLWIECDDSKTQSIGQYRGQVCWHDRHIGKWERFTTIGFANDYLHRETEKYGKTWRCWSARPTPEQMRETKWEGEKD